MPENVRPNLLQNPAKHSMTPEMGEEINVRIRLGRHHDTKSSTDIIFASAFNKMDIGREKLEPFSTHLRGFSGEKVLPLGSIQLVLFLGDPPCQAMTTARFLVVDAPSAYNMLLGRPSLNAIKTIPSAYHMMIKFPTTSGVGMVRGDQRVARECYSASMKQKNGQQHILGRARHGRRGEHPT